MAGVRRRGELIRKFILENVEKYPEDIAAVAASEFGITRQAINKHVKRLIEQGSLLSEGASRRKRYRLYPKVNYRQTHLLNSDLQEDIVWSQDIKPLIGDVPDNVREIWSYGLTEILNNAIDHSSGEEVVIDVTKDADKTEIFIQDNGEGIFKKIQRELSLIDERHAVLELSKGKLTTDPLNHSGQGIFFASRMFDEFAIVSGSVYFSHEYEKVEDWILERNVDTSGTVVFMRLSNNTSRVNKKIFDQYSSSLEEGYGFIKTVVPVRLAQYGDERLVSRSQAKRLLARVDKFKIVVFDFEDVDTIGQAFADEVFRVFNNKHPEISLIPLHASKDVQQMIARTGVQSASVEEAKPS